MTVSGTSRLVVYTGNGATLVFPYTFWVQEAADLKVYRRTISSGQLTLLTLGADYTVTGVSETANSGGNVTIITTAPTTAYEIIIVRDVADTQDLDIVNQDGFLPATLEFELDRIVMMIQDLSEQSTRALKVALGKTITSTAGHAYITDAYGNMVDGGAFDAVNAAVSAAAAAASAAAALASEIAAAASAALATGDVVGAASGTACGIALTGAVLALVPLPLAAETM